MTQANNNKEIGMKVHNIKSGKRIAVQHGELMLTPVDTVLTGESTKHKMYVAAHSESGHNHVLESKTDVRQ